MNAPANAAPIRTSGRSVSAGDTSLADVGDSDSPPGAAAAAAARGGVVRADPGRRRRRAGHGAGGLGVRALGGLGRRARASRAPARRPRRPPRACGEPPGRACPSPRRPRRPAAGWPRPPPRRGGGPSCGLAQRSRRISAARGLALAHAALARTRAGPPRRRGPRSRWPASCVATEASAPIPASRPAHIRRLTSRCRSWRPQSRERSGRKHLDAVADRLDHEVLGPLVGRVARRRAGRRSTR